MFWVFRFGVRRFITLRNENNFASSQRFQNIGPWQACLVDFDQSWRKYIDVPLQIHRDNTVQTWRLKGSETIYGRNASMASIDSIRSRVLTGVQKGVKCSLLFCLQLCRYPETAWVLERILRSLLISEKLSTLLHKSTTCFLHFLHGFWSYSWYKICFPFLVAMSFIEKLSEYILW